MEVVSSNILKGTARYAGQLLVRQSYSCASPCAYGFNYSICGCLELMPKLPIKGSFAKFSLLKFFLRDVCKKKLYQLGKSNNKATIPLNLPNPSYIIPPKYSRIRKSGQSAGLQSAVVKEYLSEISKFKYSKRWQPSLCRIFLPLSVPHLD